MLSNIFRNKFLNPYLSYTTKHVYKKALRIGFIAIPKSIIFEPTMLCNLNCQMCYQKSNRGGNADGELSFEQIVAIFNNLSNVRYVTLVGGEVFARKDIFEILRFLCNRNIIINITTNGTLLNQLKISELASFKNNISNISFSLDGDEEIHDRIRGVQGTFKRTVSAISMAVSHFNVCSNTVIVEENFEHLEEILHLGKALGLKVMNFQFEQFSAAKEIMVSENLLGEKGVQFDMDVRDPAIYYYSFENVKRALESLKEKAYELGIKTNFTPRASETHLLEQYEGTYRNRFQLDCENLYRMRVDSRGNVVLCNYIRKKMGNLMQNNVENIWNSNDFRETRTKLLQMNLFPVCRRCCKLRIVHH